MLVINCFGDSPISETDRFWEMSAIEAVTFSILAGCVVLMYTYKKIKSNGTIS